jgi:hypothetical protein
MTAPKMTIMDSVDTQVAVVRRLSATTAMVRLPNGREVFGYVGEGKDGLLLEGGKAWEARLFVADFSRAELLGPVE